ncbi:SDR family NAD(P)-dependent oxidoreductase [Sphingomonas sp. TX0543]|uniref:SDR family NAD(P)-dependent oxidoreductase n=1 Tax=Sphingomonas sp. TX0543 TaxID=3399682 RepID=UPI003AFB0270
MKGKVVIVTGGAGGQGFAEAKLLAQDGASVVVTDLNPAGEDAVKSIAGDVTFFKHDVSEASDWEKLTGLVANKFGRLDGLVNNAGLFIPAAMMDTSVELWDRHYRVNQLSIFLGMKSAAGLMKDSGGGSIVNISSLAGQVGTPGIFAYATSKWAVRGMTKQASWELGPMGIRVNSVYPGAIDTAMLDGNAMVRSDSFINGIPLRRLGLAEDLAGLIAFLISDRSAYISGAEITVTGGL